MSERDGEKSWKTLAVQKRGLGFQRGDVMCHVSGEAGSRGKSSKGFWETNSRYGGDDETPEKMTMIETHLGCVGCRVIWRVVVVVGGGAEKPSAACL